MHAFICHTCGEELREEDFMTRWVYTVHHRVRCRPCANPAEDSSILSVVRRREERRCRFLRKKGVRLAPGSPKEVIRKMNPPL
jgi:hypothetical protein